ncbi:MAG: alpha/beta fold hydrolase [Promethearchaeota archaeon]
MKKKLLGLGHRDIQLDFSLYRKEVPIPNLTDVNLSVIDIIPEKAEKTIVFIHGFAGCAETWEYQINYFAREFRVVIPDLRGHGQSDAPYTEYTMQELVEDIYTISQALKLPEKFILIGHSFGGSICVEYANAHPEQLEKLVLLSTGGEYPLNKASKIVEKVPVWMFKPWWKYRPKWNAEVHVLKRMMANNMKKWVGWDLIKNITTTSLVIMGARDKYFPRWVFENLANSVPGAQIYDVGASKHKVQLERHKAVNRAIERFIDGGQRLSWREEGSKISPLDYRPWLKSYGDYTPLTVPIPDQPLFRFLETAASWIPNRTATIFYGSKLTYSQLNKLVNQFCHVLHGLGVKKGDRVMIILPNTPQMIIAYYATLKIGGVVVLSNPDADGPAILKQIMQTQAKVLIILQEFYGLAKIIQQKFPLKVIVTELRKVVSSRVYKQLVARWEAAGFKIGGLQKDDDGVNKMSQMIKDVSDEPLDIKVSSDDLAAILFTSGTTDNPKGVCLTHKNLVANTIQTRHWIPKMIWGKETFLAVIPLTHSYGMTIAMNIAIALGAEIVLLPVFEMEQVLNHIKKYEPTVFPGVPSIYMAINNTPNARSYGLSTIKACVSGAAPLPVEVQEAFEKLTKGQLVEGYGLTEAGPVTHINPLVGERKVGSIGIPIPNTDAKIVDLINDSDLPPGQIGEMLVKGPQVMKGYWRPDGTIETKDVIKDGWLYTGDVAIMDPDGFFKIIARKRDTIMAGEFSVYPRDVEEVLYENSNVLEAAVVGIQSGDAGQKIKAFVVPRPGTKLTKKELLELCKTHLEEYAVPWEIEFREELPKSFVGKILRRMLTE